jgi:hypothetical protein
MEKECKKCGLALPAKKFPISKSTRDGLSSWCRSCQNQATVDWQSRNPEKHSKAVRANQVKDPRRYKSNVLRYKYGIDMAEYDRLFEAQGGKCAGCARPGAHLASDAPRQDKLHVDHCHKTEAVRGLLCRACNMALGGLEDDRERLLSLVAYLDKQSSQTYLTN